MKQLTLAPVSLLFLPALVLLLLHSVVPLEEFLHRGDDAFYYFQVAVNHVRYGFWTFDGIHPTNGVQPLWGGVLTVLAHALSWVGIRDPLEFARTAVALTAVVYFAACVLLYSLLARQVSVGTAIAATGALLFPLGVTAGRMWGMESPLYLLMLLISMAYFHRTFLPRQSYRTALILGLLLGVSGLTRLNAGIFVACLLAYYVLRPAHGPIVTRLRLGTIAGLAACAVLVPYFAWNVIDTGHLLPISGAVKAVRSAEMSTEYGVHSVRNALSMRYYAWAAGLQWLATSRIADGYWIVGIRTLVDGAVAVWMALLALATTAVGPFLLGRPKEWWSHLRDRFMRLAPFSYFAAYALLDAFISIAVYPSETYAAIRWWLVPLEVLITVVSATLVVAVVSYLGGRWVASRHRWRVVTVTLVALACIHGVQLVRYYWDGRVEFRDWNLSWNDESYLAAKWVSRNVPEGAVVGAWNAGVLGFFADRPVVNLDGLINNFGLLPYLRERRIADYIRDERIDYLGDLDPMFVRTEVRERLALTEVYRHHSSFMRQDYVIYRVQRQSPVEGSRVEPSVQR